MRWPRNHLELLGEQFAFLDKVGRKMSSKAQIGQGPRHRCLDRRPRRKNPLEELITNLIQAFPRKALGAREVFLKLDFDGHGLRGGPQAQHHHARLDARLGRG